ncbi:hypothetical protein LDO32_17640, partial [Luteimonas sp. Y-2-2-4F]
WSSYVWLGGTPVGLVRDGQLYHLHNDHLGRPIVATDSAKAHRWVASNFAFDRRVDRDTLGGLNLGLPGQYFDAESGHWYNGFRDYDGRTGRYLQPDPLGLTDGINPYSYSQGNPLAFYDPLGLCSCGIGGWGKDFSENWKTTSNTIDSAMSRVNPLDLPLGPQTYINFALGGVVAKSYGGTTSVQEIIRYVSGRISAPRSQFRLYPRFDTGRVLLTSVAQGVSVNVAWYDGRAIGNALYTTCDHLSYCGDEE